MLRTILLLDGSEAMNSSSDYLPSYLLALRTPVLRFVSQYLDNTPLASLGVVVMRDGVSQRLCACTTNAREVAEVLERDYFLYGGLGAMSLENGLRMALAELVSVKRSAAAAAAGKTSTHGSGSSSSVVRLAGAGGGVRPRIVLLSASVTLVDPTDVLQVVRLLARCGVVVDIVSFAGAVHVFDECTRQTGGRLCCPLSYDHVLRILRELTHGVNAHGERGGGSTASLTAATTNTTTSAATVRMLPIGFPLMLTRPATATTTTTTTTVTATGGGGGGDDAKHKSQRASAVEYYLACPQCHLLQTAVPSTCALCKLLLCAVVLMYATYVAHNRLLPPARPLTQRLLSRSRLSSAAGAAAGARRQRQQPQNDDDEQRCSLCNDLLPSVVVAAAATTASATTSHDDDDADVEVDAMAAADAASCTRWRCVGCGTVRCARCHLYITETLRLCPQCIATR